MGNLLFLFIAIALSAVGILVVWLRQRGPTGRSGVSQGVDSFSRQMQALAPDHRQPGQRRDGPDRG